MADYWKSLPKKYCDFCKCWITDNKSSRDFHERGFRHQANVRRRVKEIQKNSSIQDRERQQYYNDLVKIEAAALSSFKNDVARDPKLAAEYAKSKSIASQILNPISSGNKPISTTNRFGEEIDISVESQTLVNGKKRALETIDDLFKKKSRWLEANTSDGKKYYWNKETFETRHDPPKSGFLSLAEQEQLKNLPGSSVETTTSGTEVYRNDPYGGWKKVERNNDTSKMIDLQLPGQDVSQIVFEIEQTEMAEKEKEEMGRKNTIEFKEKTLESLNKSLVSKNEKVSFIKKSNQKNRTIRNRIED